MPSSVLRNRIASQGAQLTNPVENTYRYHRFETTGLVATNVFGTAEPTEYRVSGDTITIAKINGGGVIQFRIGQNNPWLDVEENVIITREFDVIYVRDVGLYTGKTIQYPTSCEFYTSYGPLLYRPTRSHSLRNAAEFGHVTLAANTWTNVFAVGSDDADGDFAGGTILLKCDSTSPSAISVIFGPNNLTITHKPPATEGFIIRAGEFVSFDYDGRFLQVNGQAYVSGPFTASTIYTLMAAPVTGASTAEMMFIINRRTSFADKMFAYINGLPVRQMT